MFKHNIIVTVPHRCPHLFTLNLPGKTQHGGILLSSLQLYQRADHCWRNHINQLNRIVYFTSIIRGFQHSLCRAGQSDGAPHSSFTFSLTEVTLGSSPPHTHSALPAEYRVPTSLRKEKPSVSPTVKYHQTSPELYLFLLQS